MTLRISWSSFSRSRESFESFTVSSQADHISCNCNVCCCASDFVMMEKANPMSRALCCCLLCSRAAASRAATRSCSCASCRSVRPSSKSFCHARHAHCKYFSSSKSLACLACSVRSFHAPSRITSWPCSACTMTSMHCRFACASTLSRTAFMRSTSASWARALRSAKAVSRQPSKTMRSVMSSVSLLWELESANMALLTASRFMVAATSMCSRRNFSCLFSSTTSRQQRCQL
mmetsp:Transcript_2209/g.4651  ORF Transcript_2209/g.4651 Transcript_2209/m.4651 type:complete len:232 (+) Transcript_2209:615-1310(+)